MTKLCLQLLFAETVRGWVTTRRITVIGRHDVVWSAPTFGCLGLCLLDVNRFGSGSVLFGSARGFDSVRLLARLVVLDWFGTVRFHGSVWFG